MAAGVAEDQVAVCSTGVIGVQLDARDVVEGPRRGAAPSCAPTARGDLQRGDHDHRPVREARARSTVDLPGGTVRLTRAGQGRGDDPAELRDDALLRADRRRAERRDRGPAARRSASQRCFDRITVDGQLSTNDTVILQAQRRLRRASSSRSPRTSSRFGEALDALLRELALAIVRDGEGAERIGRVVVRGGHADERRARPRARSPTRRS